MPDSPEENFNPDLDENLNKLSGLFEKLMEAIGPPSPEVHLQQFLGRDDIPQSAKDVFNILNDKLEIELSTRDDFKYKDCIRLLDWMTEHYKRRVEDKLKNLSHRFMKDHREVFNKRMKEKGFKQGIVEIEADQFFDMFKDILKNDDIF